MKYTPLNEAQYEQLLKPLNSTRVKTRSVAGTSLSYLETWDVRAMMIRIFGFGGWSFDVQEAVCVFESEKDGKWNVGWKVIGRLTVQELYCTYTEAAVGSATLGSRGEAHDMAIKTAESDAFKRACVNLGTQFGLSLYDSGATRDVVMTTLSAIPDDAENNATIAAVKELIKPLAPPVEETPTA
jgi:recombination DNA repair RAD52 pathway protein